MENGAYNFLSQVKDNFFSRVISRFQPSRLAAFTSKDRHQEPIETVPAPVPVLAPAAVTEISRPEVETAVAEAGTEAVVPPSAGAVSPQKRGRAITTATDSFASPLSVQAAQAEVFETKDPVREGVLISLEQDLLSLLNQTSFVLVRAKRPPAVSGAAAPGSRRRSPAGSPAAPVEAENAPAEISAHGPFGANTMGRETAQRIEGRARGLLLETSLTRSQQDRIDRILQSTQFLLCALQASRYAWQMALLLPQEGPSGRVALLRLKQASECVIEMSNRVAYTIEGRDGAAGAVAEQYRAFLTITEETALHFSTMRDDDTLSQTARRLVRVAMWSITVAAESMAKVAARFALPIETSREVNKEQEKYKQMDRGDDLLAPIQRR